MALRPVDEVIDELLSRVNPVQATLIRQLDEALGCCLAGDVESPVDVPPADNSAMDGYAVALSTLGSGNPIPVSDRIPAGSIGNPLVAGSAARIFTGAPIPAGADTVVIQENITLIEGGIRINEQPAIGENIRARGQDISRGMKIVSKGDRLSPQVLALIASVGLPEVLVFRPLRIAVMSTGDELVQPGRELAPGQIYNSNRYAMAGMVRSLGFDVIDLGIIPDDPEATRQALLQASADADCILTSGGVSVGEEDHVKDAVEQLGRIDIWKLAIKPGKPLAYGEVCGTPFFGLPGNPVSTFVTLQIIARPYLLALQGFSQVLAQTVAATAAFSFSGGSRREYLRVRTRWDDGQFIAEPFANQGSGIMTSVVWADALAEIDVDRQVKPGDRLKLYPLPG